MIYKKTIYNRKSIRLRDYDYSQQGLYFLTICTHNRACLFGDVVNGDIILNDAGVRINHEWEQISQRFPQILLHEHIIMPNHMHAIIEIVPVGATLVVAHELDNPNNLINDADDNSGIVIHNYENEINHISGQPQGIAPTKTIGNVVAAFKSITTHAYIQGVKTKNWECFNKKLWQRNYYEHIIRTPQSYNYISNYILQNPNSWKEDEFYL